MKIIERPRRSRQSSIVRNMLAETDLQTEHLIYPLFVENSTQKQTEIVSMPGQFRWNPESILFEIEACLEKGLRSFCLFPKFADSEKDSQGSLARSHNYYVECIAKIKEKFPETLVMTDIALDPYSSDGHDGIVKEGKILNDESLAVFQEMALLQAQAGADILGPSDMMDGRVGAIRHSLEEHGFKDTMILSYTAKYASAFYGPFREALDSAPRGGDKKSYQMDFRNSKEAVREARLDIAEGADILMVKPALCYLDVIADLENRFDIPIAAYNVSGEYSMIQAASRMGFGDSKALALEALYSIRRAGASIILTYFAKDFADWAGKGMG